MYSVNYNDTTLTFFNRYTNPGLIGKGAQGLILSAFDEKTQQNVAIKKLTRPFAHPKDAKRTYREFVILNLINHQNIIKLLNAYTPQENVQEFFDVYLVMELMIENLSKIRLQNYDQEHLSFLMYQMLCGINHLHKSGIIHRDLKPANIGITRNGVLKILDFGLACPTKSPSLTDYVTTRFYRAPEVILGLGYDESVDIWSLGCIFAELITGTVLFPGKDHIDQWTKIIRLMGTPNKEFFEKLPNSTRNYIQSLPEYSPQPWEVLISDSLFPPWKNDAELTASNARDLISKMLVINPNERITVRDAINHSYVKIWFKTKEVDGPASPTYDGSIDQLALDVDGWKQAIFNQIQSYSATKNLS